MSKHRPSRMRVALIAIGFILIPIFVSRIGLGAIATMLHRLGPECLLILLPYALGTALAAFPWSWLLEGTVRVRASATIASRFAASGANALLPFFGFAGEPCRLLWLPSHARASGLAAIVVDRLLYTFSGGLFLLFGAIATLQTRLPRSAAALAGSLGAMMLVGTFLVLLAISRWGIGTRLQGLARRFLERPGDALGAELDEALRAVGGRPYRSFFSAVVLHFVARVVLSMEVAVALWSINAPTSSSDAIVLASVPVVTSVLASSIPSQIGVQEGAQALVSAALGFDPALGFSLVLLQRMRQLVFVSLAPILIAGARARGEMRKANAAATSAE